MTSLLNNKERRAVRNVLVVVVGIVVVATLFRLTGAGLLSPSTAPASSAQSFEDLYNSLASDGYDSSAVTPSKNGNALQIAKCIMAKMTGGAPCP